MTRKGKSRSRRPVSTRVPGWCGYSPEEVEAFIIKLTKEGESPSKIGVILRDQYGIPLVKPIVGKSILQVINDAGLAVPIPEDLNNLIQQATRIRRHLTRNRGDGINKRSLELVVSKIRRLIKYYKRRGILAENWEYKSDTVLMT